MRSLNIFSYKYKLFPNNIDDCFAQNHERKKSDMVYSARICFNSHSTLAHFKTLRTLYFEGLKKKELYYYYL